MSPNGIWQRPGVDEVAAPYKHRSEHKSDQIGIKAAKRLAKVNVLSKTGV
ncbi:MAG: hypothetical protein H7A36_01720 [Chlamydiales bacterium]|nr:hypothetical protein [Chlamydiales bacterium]